MQEHEKTSGAKQKPSLKRLAAVVELEEILAHTPAGAASIRPDGSIVVGMTRPFCGCCGACCDCPPEKEGLDDDYF